MPPIWTMLAAEKRRDESFMKQHLLKLSAAVILASTCFIGTPMATAGWFGSGSKSEWLSPTALAATTDGKLMFDSLVEALS